MTTWLQNLVYDKSGSIVIDVVGTSVRNAMWREVGSALRTDLMHRIMDEVEGDVDTSIRFRLARFAEETI